MSQHLFGHGRLSYVQIPGADVQASATFREVSPAWRKTLNRHAHSGVCSALVIASPL
jgi:hypothetical protein